MNPNLRSRALAVAAALLFAAVAARAETTLLLDINFGIRHVPDSRVSIPSGEYLTITAPDFGPLQWHKNGNAIPGATGKSLILPSASVADGGTYFAEFTSPELSGKGTQNVTLSVRPMCRLVNLSTRAQVGQGEGTFIAGFVVTGPETKKIIVRAVGPTLAGFGIENPVQHPAITIFDSEGKPYTNAYVYPACVGCPTYESDLAESLIRAGAFPLPEGAGDVVEMRPFTPGSYTVHVTSADGAPGVVLFEVFEVP